MDNPVIKFQAERRANIAPPEIRFIRLKEVLAICGMSRTSVYEAIKEKKFPAPVRLYGRSTAWIKSEVQQWAQSRVNASRSEP